MTADVCARLRELHGDGVEPAAIADLDSDATAIAVRPEALAHVMRSLRDEASLGFEMLLDASAVDHAPRTPRFELAYQLLSVENDVRVTVRVVLSDDDPRVDSVSEIWPSADWFEREIWDLHGLRFIGHPNLERLFLDVSFEGHPLRKDFPKRGAPLPRSEEGSAG